jgi:hypothetical protein
MLRCAHFVVMTRDDTFGDNVNPFAPQIAGLKGDFGDQGPLRMTNPYIPRIVSNAGIMT